VVRQSSLGEIDRMAGELDELDRTTRSGPGRPSLRTLHRSMGLRAWENGERL
jgi:hypothetical protein